MIDKLNFSKVGSNMNIESPLSSLGDELLTVGKYFNQRDIAEQERLTQAKRDLYQRGRDAIADARYEADKKERLEDKNRLLQKDYNTANAMSAIENRDAYIAGRMSAEKKAIENTLANATPEERFQMQQELKGYDPKASGQQWADTALSQSNIDSKDITNLKRDITKEAEQIRQFNENKRIAQENFNKTYSLQKLQYDQAAQEKKDKEAGQLAYVNGLNTNVDNSTKILRDSKTGEKYIPTENLESYKKSYEEFANSPEMIKMKNELVDVQKNAGQIYTKEQLADEKFLYNEYNKLNPKALQKSTFELKGFKIIEDEKKDLEIKKLEEQASAIERSGISDFNTPEENMNAKNKAEAIRSQILTINNERKKGQTNTPGSFEDFVANTRATNAAKELDLKTKIYKYDSAYKAQDLKLKNEFGKIKQDEVVIPKTEDEYAQDLYNANTAGKTLSVDEKVGFMKSAKERAATHQKKVEKEEKAALDIRLKEIEKTSDTNKLLVGEVEKENSSIRQAINDARREDDSKDYSYAGSGGKKMNRQAYISELEAQLYQNNNRIDKILGIKK